MSRSGRTIAWMAILVLGTGCHAASTSTSSPPMATSPSGDVSAPPAWRPGDRWVYAWTTGSEKGTKTVEITDIPTVNGVRYYVARIGEVYYYYTSDLHWAAVIRDSRVEARMAPPQPWYVWPLTVGRRWTHEGTFEDRTGRRIQRHRFAVVEAESVDVPAGRFQALKIVRETEGVDNDQYWYAPAVRSYVRWIGRRGDASFDEQLEDYTPAPRLIEPPTARDDPSKK